MAFAFATLAALPVRAQIPTPDTIRAIPPRTLPTPEDSALVAPSGIRVVGPGARARATADTTRKPAWYNQPRFVMARSLVIPGWGQAHNRSWIKAALVAGVETWLGVKVVQDQRALDDMLSEINALRADTTTATTSARRARENELVNRYNSRLDQRLGRQWMLGGVIAYALVDAYVDAHFRGFDLEFQHDPALPPGTSPATSADRGGRFGLRVALRRNF